MPKQLAEPVSPCHAICVECIWTNTPAVKGQVTSSQAHGCQPSEQIRVCLNLQLKIWLQILSHQVLSLQQDPAQKSRHAAAHIKTQPIRPLSDSWILVFSKLLWLQACSTVRGTGNSSSRGISSWCCSLFTFLHLCAPEIPDTRPAASPWVLSPFATAVLCQACCIILSHSGPIASETLGWRRRQDDKHKYPLLQHQQGRRKVLCQGGGWHFLRAEYKLCGTPSPPHICVSLLLKYL